MKPYTKKIAFLEPKPNMNFDDFDMYWSSVHGPVVANSPNYKLYRNKYVQNHIYKNSIIGNEFPYAGVAEFWITTEKSNEREFAKTDTYKFNIKPDEINFIDMNKTIAMSGSEIVFLTSKNSSKLMLISERQDEFDMSNMDYTSAQPYFSFITNFLDPPGKMTGYSIDVIEENSFSLPGAKPSASLRIACIETFRFPSQVSARSAFQQLIVSADFDEARRGAGLGHFQALLAEELVFFENGAPTRLATGAST